MSVANFCIKSFSYLLNYCLYYFNHLIRLASKINTHDYERIGLRLFRLINIGIQKLSYISHNNNYNKRINRLKQYYNQLTTEPLVDKRNLILKFAPERNAESFI